MDLDLQSLFGLHAQLYSLTETPQTNDYTTPPRSPRIGAHMLTYEGSIGQPKQTTSLCDPLTCPSLHITLFFSLQYAKL